MRKGIIQAIGAFIFVYALFTWGSCTHPPGIYYDNKPLVSQQCSVDTIYFQNDILPLLNSTCAVSGCHDAATGKHNVVLTDYAAVMKTGGINLQNPAESKIYRVLGKGGDESMPPPPAAAWSTEQQNALLTWIGQGALNNACANTVCDTSNVTFKNNVDPIFQTYCYGCHSAGNTSGGIDLTNFSQLALLIDNGSLLGSIRHDAGFIPMPQGGNKLSDCEINTIAIWARDTTLTGGGGNTGSSCDPDTTYFQNQVLPLLQSNCAVSGCHDAATRKEGVQLTDYNSVVKTGGVVAGNPNRSKLYTILSGGGDDDKSTQDGIMPPPPRAAFTTEQKNLVKNWILQGAKDNVCDGCDTTQVSFKTSVFPIVETYCLGCHNGNSPGGGIYLRNYSDLVAVAKNGKLWGSINHETGYSPMPKNASKLSTCQLATFKIWIDNGTPNN